MCGLWFQSWAGHVEVERWTRQEMVSRLPLWRHTASEAVAHPAVYQDGRVVKVMDLRSDNFKTHFW